MAMTPDSQIARLQYAMRERAREIDRLQAEIDRLVDWIMGDKDALTEPKVIEHIPDTAS